MDTRGKTAFVASLRGHVVAVVSDNVTCLTYIRKLRGTQSKELCALAIRIWELAQQNNINLETVFIPGRENVKPDYLSRINQDLTENKEWILQRQIFVIVNRLWGPLRRDLFASHTNHQLPHYIPNLTR